MESVNFIIADVFTDLRFGGNQLAVFLEGSALDSETMQKLAREMHFSETTFLLPPKADGDFAVRIFTPETELPFAGHPIVGTAYVIVSEKLKATSQPATLVRLETGVGLLSIEVLVHDGLPGQTIMTQPLPEIRKTFNDVERLAKAFGLTPTEIRSQLPAQAIYNGVTVLIVPITSLSAIQNIKVDIREVERISHEVGAQTVLAFSQETINQAHTAHCRVFAPAAGVVEDAATGSANGPLGFYLVHHRLIESSPCTQVISEQGFEMNRPSLLHIEVSINPTTNEVEKVRVGGRVVISGEGRIFLSCAK